MVAVLGNDVDARAHTNLTFLQAFTNIIRAAPDLVKILVQEGLDVGAVGRWVKPKALGVASVVDDPEFLGGVGGLVIFQRHAGRALPPVKVTL